MFLAIEAGLVVLAVGVAFIFPKVGAHGFEVLEQWFGKLARRRCLAVFVVGLTALGLRAALLPVLPIPSPGGHDSYAYLLLSDTFAHGRLTNPTNPMWVHFESFHIIWQPTYTAMFYPAQGLIMALGQVLTGRPFWGVWLSVGLMCAAITWMLQGWLTPGWALLGGLLAVIRLGTFSYWADSYSGGAMAAIGGALVLGALPRLKRSLRIRDALLMGLGFAVIANSRPYEGLFFGLAVGGVLLFWTLKERRSDLGLLTKRVVTPILLVMALTAIAMGYYFWRTTGSPWRTPYRVDTQTYNPVPYFPWQALRPIPAYRHAIFRKFYLQTFALPQYEAARSLKGMLALKFIQAMKFWGFFWGPVFTLPLAVAWVILPYGFPWSSLSRKTRSLLVICAVTLAGEALPIYFNPHYAAPLTGAILALVLIAIRQMRTWQPHGKPAGLFLSRAVPLICVLLFALRAAATPLHLRVPRQWIGGTLPSWCSMLPMNYERAKMLARLDQFPGQQLVIVHYKADHEIVFHEWVYNRADLNSAKVIWARDMGPEENEELIHYFKDRHVWLVDADSHPPKLVPYSEAADPGSLAGDSKTP